MGKPGELQFAGLQRVGHDSATEQQRSLEASSQEFCGCLRLGPNSQGCHFCKVTAEYAKEGAGPGGTGKWTGERVASWTRRLDIPFLLGFLLRSQAPPTRTM